MVENTSVFNPFKFLSPEDLKGKVLIKSNAHYPKNFGIKNKKYKCKFDGDELEKITFIFKDYFPKNPEKFENTSIKDL